MRPLILLSPAKNLSVEGALTPALSAAKPTQCIFLEQSRALLDSAKALSKPELKKLMKLSDSLTTLNYDRFAGFEAQPSRVAIGSFYGMVNPPLAAHALLAYQRTSPPIPSMTSHLRIDPNVRDRYVSNSQGGFVTVPQAYKGLDAPTLDIPALDYLQSSLRILCGLYGIVRPYDEIKPYLFFMPFFFLTTFFQKKGIVRPYDEIRPYRLEMSTKLKCGDNPDLYSFWGSRLTEALNEEIESGHVSFVLNVASQEYASSVELAKLKAPVITADFPGPTVYTKEARGQASVASRTYRMIDPGRHTHSYSIPHLIYLRIVSSHDPI